ncbi:flagellar biosynthesis protein FlhA [Hydrogenispora ethanolica]|jgi:flagellar biosynthesis protein FlhA|uniref:Flagellar biosynthesis protein FlhA n=1 Tax=Hydrogenispora ethanolica TaxID=1082276 RepID=A0A4R1RK55_HYDET|nr:flagellar biosynthesis protein FlhA [Hydrogenispora ethanolica]TCL66561.1 flagellar biosynthesis protein FlhA [Hydrogenispora ethanolica]
MAQAMNRTGIFSWNSLRNGEVVVALIVTLVLTMFIIPLPSVMLDLFITLNICGGFAIVLLTTYVQKSLEFSVFPTLLLLTTLFRLALSVSSTRLILLNAEAGRVIEAFGQVVAGHNYVVGFVMFIILTIIQFLVITKGSERVAEVAARFTLDAMPGKQMSIDADLNAGLINETDARARRREVEREADFYGAMDGASKFVKGDAIAGILIIIINIVGGFIIGATQKGFTIQQSLQTYSLLTIGDGLVTQIPALLLSTATGILVTRSASEDNLGSDLARQLLAYPKIFYFVAGMIGFFGIIPGMPKLAFFTIAAIIGFMGYRLQTAPALNEPAAAGEGGEEAAEEVKKPENVNTLLQIDPMELEIGYRLIPLVDPNQGGDLFERVTMIRRQTALELGMVLPPIRIRDNMQLLPTSYVIKIKGVEVTKGEIIPNHYLAMDPGIVAQPVEGIATTEPAFGLPAIWITEAQRDEAEISGYTVVDPPSVLATHLTEVIKSHAYELLGRQEVQSLINNLKEEYNVVVGELIPNLMTIGEVQKVLVNLLKEGIPIRNLVTVLETLADYAPMTKDPELLTEYVRQALNRQITKMVQSEDGVIRVITLDPELEQTLLKIQKEAREGTGLAVDPRLIQQIYDKLGALIQEVNNSGGQPVILCSPGVRLTFRKLIERLSSRLMVLSYNEISPEAEVHSIGVVAIHS